MCVCECECLVVRVCLRVWSVPVLACLCVRRLPCACACVRVHGMACVCMCGMSRSSHPSGPEYAVPCRPMTSDEDAATLCGHSSGESVVSIDSDWRPLCLRASASPSREPEDNVDAVLASSDDSLDSMPVLHVGGASPSRRRAHAVQRRDTLPRAGFWRGDAWVEVRFDRLPVAPRLGVRLQQEPGASDFVPTTDRPGGRALRLGREPTIRYFGTIRQFPATHKAAPVLTVRNQRELPSCLYFHPDFISTCRERRLPRHLLRHVNPAFAEWLMGLPNGWTWPMPHDLPLASPLAQWPPRRARWRTLSLFSGIGALDLGLSPWCVPIAYVERSDTAVAVLRARMADGSLERRPLHTDVRDVTASDLHGPVDGIVAGFPCTGTSQAGHRAGLQQPETALVEEIFRLATATQCWFIFLENVANLRSMPEVWRHVYSRLRVLGFCIRWVTVDAAHVGIPMRRSRWFCYAARGIPLRVLADPPSGAPGQEPWLGACALVPRPPPHEWMVASASGAPRLALCGLAVVPRQAFLAVRLLSSANFPASPEAYQSV